MAEPAVLWVFVLIAVILRIASVVISARNERRLRAEGAVELGAANTRVLAGAHVVFYLAAIVERAVGGPWTFDLPAVAGLVLYLFGMAALGAVIRGLGRLWTVKLILAEDHTLVTSPLFRLARHPNYFLNILPELIGFALVLHSYVTLAIGLPLYLVPLVIRIRQEERAMRERFPAY
jgi:isoprenylcysteine carboxyl methyltransferase (ICMT) family protein YpbQ